MYWINWKYSSLHLIWNQNSCDRCDKWLCDCFIIFWYFIVMELWCVSSTILWTICKKLIKVYCFFNIKKGGDAFVVEVSLASGWNGLWYRFPERTQVNLAIAMVERGCEFWMKRCLLARGCDSWLSCYLSVMRFINFIHYIFLVVSACIGEVRWEFKHTWCAPFM